jgi:hypothetical protein
MTGIPNDKLNELESGIIKTLLYSGIFEYPLTFEELVKYCRVKIIDLEQFKLSLKRILDKKLVYQIDGFLLLKEESEYIKKRIVANRFSKKLLPVALKFSKTLMRFPFLRGICLSGSISKNNFSIGNDIDFFIIAEQKRVWLLRFLLIIYHKTLQQKHKKYFCLNYFIQKNTIITPMNIFIASELASLIPTCGEEICFDFINLNNWTKDYYPNHQYNPIKISSGDPVNHMKKFIEFICRNWLFDFVDYALMKILILRKHWQIKRNKISVSDKNAFFSTVNNRIIRMNHIHDNQLKILKLFEQSIHEFEKEKQVKLFDTNE